MSHFEDLLFEFYVWRGCIVKRNLKVGKRSKGGWEMEIDIVVYDPETRRVLHLEPSLNAHSWEKRERQFEKKFTAGRKYIPTEVFPWIGGDTSIQQVAILPYAGAKRRSLAGAKVVTVDEVMAHIREAVRSVGNAAHAAISEQFPLLRTIQFTVSGYSRVVDDQNEASGSLRLTPISPAVSGKPF